MKDTRRKGLPLVLAAVSVLAAGCSSTPEPPPRLRVAAAFGEARAWQPAVPQDATPRGAWWRVFGDPGLDRLEPLVARANASLQVALASYQQAMALTRVSQAQFYPTVAASVGESRSETGAYTSFGQPSIQFGPSSTASTALTATWVPDLWGQVRDTVAANAATAAASAATLAATLLSLQATLAQTYFQLRILDAQWRLADNTVRAYAQALQLTENRYRGGVATIADVAQARAQWLTAQVQRTDLRIQRDQALHAIAVLVGRQPANFQLPAVSGVPAAPDIPPGLPSQLLQRRPDLAAAERRAAAANAEIGVAQTAWFPSLTLSAQAGRRAGSMAQLLSAPSSFWSVGPTLAETLFDGGARSARIAAAKAGYRQTVADYRATALQAFQQAEDNLVAQRILVREAALQHQAVLAAEQSLGLAINQYKAGTVPYLNVISAQTISTSAQNTELLLRGRQLTAAVLLIQALGGGWGRATAPAIGVLPVAPSGDRDSRPGVPAATTRR